MKKYLKEKEITLSHIFILLTIVLILLIGIILYLFTLHNPTNLYYNVNYYGTVDSWVMIGVTSITGVAIFLTLRSQMKVQKDQNEIKEIEVKRYRSSIAPKLVLLSQQSTYDSHTKTHRLELSFTFHNNPSVRTRITSKLPLQITLSTNPNLLKRHSETEEGDIYMISEAVHHSKVITIVTFLDTNFTKLFDPDILNFVFEDDDNNLISQNIKIFLEYFNTCKATEDSPFYLKNNSV